MESSVQDNIASIRAHGTPIALTVVIEEVGHQVVNGALLVLEANDGFEGVFITQEYGAVAFQYVIYKQNGFFQAKTRTIVNHCALLTGNN
ncbi:MAG: hypothetical protein ACRCVE_00150 [Plesiomonas sp.]